MRSALEAEADLPPVPEVWRALEKRGELTPVDVFVALIEHFRPPSDTAHRLRAIEKTPRHVLHLDTLSEHFPDAQFVNVVRDPIDVASSLLNVPWEPSRSVISLAHRWAESVLAACQFSAQHAERIHTVTYEILVREPEASTRSLCEFLDMRYEPAMLEEFGSQAARNVGRGETWKRDVVRGVLLDRKGVWRERMSPGQAWLVAQSTGQLRREYSFSLPPTASVWSIFLAVLSELRVRFHEARASNGLIGSARHAGSVLKALAAT
jgi:hypothetical protein